ncbi:ATP-binding protein [Alkalinema pantanalense CENA528]|uniref:ATP-binding response regulator n=1 Tax=Alkalinema pantanalense TaxID=1620705 RepID=UPI003D6F581F
MLNEAPPPKLWMTPAPGIFCSATLSLRLALLQCQQWHSDRVLVVDAQSRVRGVLFLHQLVPKLLDHSLDGEQSLEDLQPLWGEIDPQGLRPFVLEQMPCFLELLNYLPLPALLNSRQLGRWHSNLHWQKLVEDLEDPMALLQWVNRLFHREMLASDGDCMGSEGSCAMNEPIVPSQKAAPSPAVSSPVATAPTPLSILECLPSGDDCSSYLCRCGLRTGQEVILQFTRVSLSSTLLAATNGLQEPSPGLGGQGRPRSQGEMTSGHGEPTQSVQPTQMAAQIATLERQAEGGPMAAIEDWELIWVQDVTEQHQLTRELAAKNADLIQLNRLKDDFLACMSHELRTPLTAVLGLSGLMKEESVGALNDRQRRYVQLIHRSGKHLMHLVNDILDLTRMEAGQIELSWQTIRIAEICQIAFDQAQQMRWPPDDTSSSSPQSQDAHRDGHPVLDSSQSSDLALEVQPGLETVVADPNRLKQMLVHLLSNALKFTEPEGKVGIRVANWEGWIAFTVWDTGIGIPADKQHLIFQKFQQLESPLTRQFEGTGLGLVLTQRLARLHGGDVTFISRENKGSQFTLLLPPTPPVFKSVVTIEDPPSGISSVVNRLVLVVEVSVRSLEDASDQLMALNYRVIVARSGTEALEKARQLQPCAILLNPFLPMLSGWDVLTLLKSDPKTCQIPVIVMASSAEQHQAYCNQADGFLGLPIRHRLLAHMLDQLTQNSVEGLDHQSSEVQTIQSILCLTSELESDEMEWSHLLHSHNYRVIEAADLEQAELLARVWQPKVVLLSGQVSDPLSYLNQLRSQTCLASLPIVVLDTAIAQAATQIKELTIFPCLMKPKQWPLAPQMARSLVQVIELAVKSGARQPFILAVDGAIFSPRLGHESKLLTQGMDWLNALMHYIQTAGLRGGIVPDQLSLLHRLQTQLVQQLLVYWHEGVSAETIKLGLHQVNQVNPHLPVLLIDYHTKSGRRRGSFTAMPNVQVTLPSLSMEGLLDQVRQRLGLQP